MRGWRGAAKKFDIKTGIDYLIDAEEKWSRWVRELESTTLEEESEESQVDKAEVLGFDPAIERRKNWRSIIRFGRKAFPGWVSKEISPFHRFLEVTMKRVVTAVEPQRRVDMAPRGSAKSTWVSKILVLWIICHKEEITNARKGEELDFILLTSNVLALPTSFIRDIRRELEVNEYIRMVYPAAAGKSDGKWTEQLIQTRNNIWVLAGSTGKTIRGALQSGSRPKLIVGDDLENLEQVKTLVQRDKIEQWFDDDLIPAGDPNCHVWCIGTPLHEDSLLNRLRKRFDGRKFRSVIRFSQASNLWDQWRELYLDIEGEIGDTRTLADRLFEKFYELILPRIKKDSIRVDDESVNKLYKPFKTIFKEVVGQVADEDLMRYALGEAVVFMAMYGHLLPDAFDELREEWEAGVFEAIRSIKGRRTKAYKFFLEHKEEMLEGTRVLWPEAEDYYRLMCQREDAASRRSWYQEKQCESRSSEEKIFTEHVWRFWKAPRSGVPQDMKEALEDKNVVFVGAVDPSMGKDSRKHDPAAIVVIGGVPGKWCRIAWAWIRREHPTKLIERIYAAERVFKCYEWVIESVQFQELFADNVVEALGHKGMSLPVRKYKPSASKELRIIGLEPVVTTGLLEYPARRTDDGAMVPLYPVLWEQFVNYGDMDVHDDGPDAIAMAWDSWKHLEKRAFNVPIEFTQENRTAMFENETSERGNGKNGKGIDDFMKKIIQQTK